MGQSNGVRVCGGLARVVRYGVQCGIRTGLVCVGRHIGGDVQNSPNFAAGFVADEREEGDGGLDEPKEVNFHRLAECGHIDIRSVLSGSKLADPCIVHESVKLAFCFLNDFFGSFDSCEVGDVKLYELDILETISMKLGSASKDEVNIDICGEHGYAHCFLSSCLVSPREINGVALRFLSEKAHELKADASVRT